MTERWQRELSKIRRVELGTDLWDRILEQPRTEPVRQPPRSRAFAAAVALALFAAATVLVWTSFRSVTPRPVGLGDSNVVEVPPAGETTAAFLADGHPVFVTHRHDGGVVVIDAFSPRRQFGIGQLAMWCATKPYFLTWPDPSFFDRSGVWTSGTSAPPGLRSYALDVISRDADGNPSRLRVTSIGLVIPHHSNPFGHRPDPSACGLASGSFADVVEHQIPSSLIWSSPLALTGADPHQWVPVAGTLQVDTDGSVHLCSSTPANRCTDGANVVGVDGAALGRKLRLDPTSRYGYPHLWLARVDHGAIVELAVADHS